mmetsp:Transcript_207/g.531  ORF Transcript_207/g.531 Transcript_207/m.531 type:complete len:136 (-) Transcript_207:788-1195(-)
MYLPALEKWNLPSKRTPIKGSHTCTVVSMNGSFCSLQLCKLLRVTNPQTKKLTKSLSEYFSCLSLERLERGTSIVKRATMANKPRHNEPSYEDAQPTCQKELKEYARQSFTHSFIHSFNRALQIPASPQGLCSVT